MISTGAARAANSSLILLIWDVLEVCHYKPTEMIYENTVVAFASEEGGLRQAFAALASMKEDGYNPSRPLIRSLSLAIRSNRQVVDNALQILLRDYSLLSLESLNVVMSCYAERGDTEQALEILTIMENNNIKPDVDSYSFAIEVLGKNIHSRKKTDDSSYLHRSVEIAGSILTKMEQDGLFPSADVVRNYVELLCLVGEVETATSVVEDFLSGRTDAAHACVNNKAIYRVAIANAEVGNIEKAKELAKQTSEDIPILHRKIRSSEQRWLHLAEIDSRKASTSSND
jgi:pentatricopeptide repeat protein